MRQAPAGSRVGWVGLPGEFVVVGVGGGGVLGELAVADHVEAEPGVGFVFDEDLEAVGVFPFDSGYVGGERGEVEVVDDASP